ncbi:MAG: ATP phosphoribosyltransferase regulatory subunit [Lachnospiraceae bacterium]|nr:ATP phosphoribosyltransferase regulatory subunit [Lachnospiraceae bacterium]
MEQRLLHTPEGVRDIYSGEYARKKALQEKLHRVIESYGYCDIETPTFEYFDVFSREVGTIPSRDLYKFFDREGNTLVLRPDMTPAIARAYAKYFSEEDLGVRLSYMGNTYINNSSFQGRLKETTQLGAELLGDGSVEADAEITAMIVELLLKAGLKDFQVSIGQVEFFRSLLLEAGVDETTGQELKKLITNKNNFGVENLLEELHLNAELTDIFKSLPQMFGNVEILDRAGSMTKNKGALEAIARLRTLYEILKKYGYEKYVSFDLGMIGSYMYYTGVIFRAYTFGTGDAIVKGGRYDQLLGHFGKPAASVGFVVQIDQLLNALSRQKIEVPTEEGPMLLLYEANRRDEAIQEAVKLRNEGGKAALMMRRSDLELAHYAAYAKRNDLKGILYFAENGETKQIQPQEVTA